VGNGNAKKHLRGLLARRKGGKGAFAEGNKDANAASRAGGEIPGRQQLEEE